MQILEIEDKKQELILSYRRFSKAVQNSIQQNNISRGLLTDYLYAITQFAKQHVEDTLKKFDNEKLKDIDNLVGAEQITAYQIQFQLRKTLFNEYEYIVDLAHQKTHNGKHFSKYIKKCYHCGQIWFKSVGCGGKTVCGRLNDNPLDEFINNEEALQIFKVSYIKGKLTITQDDSVKPGKVVLTEKNKQNLMMDEKIKQSVSIVNLGCGIQRWWNGMQKRNKVGKNETIDIRRNERNFRYFGYQVV